MTSPPYLVYQFKPLNYFSVSVQIYSRKQHLSNINNSKVFLYYMLCTHTFSSALFNSNINVTKQTNALDAKPNCFLTFKKNQVTVQLELVCTVSQIRKLIIVENISLNLKQRTRKQISSPPTTAVQTGLWRIFAARMWCLELCFLGQRLRVAICVLQLLIFRIYPLHIKNREEILTVK